MQYFKNLGVLIDDNHIFKGHIERLFRKDGKTEKLLLQKWAAKENLVAATF